MGLAAPATPVDAASFWARFQRLVAGLQIEHAHANVVLIIQDGTIKQVRVDRSFLPGSLPDVK